jgi:uncharacterized membrane protein
MNPWLIVLILIALGWGVGGWLARRFPLTKVTALCAGAATIGGITMAAIAAIRDSPTTYVGMAVAVIMGCDLLITLLRRWQAE